FGHADNSCPKREPNKPASVSCEKDNTTVRNMLLMFIRRLMIAKSKNQVEKENTSVKNLVKNVPNDSSSDEGKSEKSKKNGMDEGEFGCVRIL
ncbi:hypothetical protein Tco_1187063, partial [Tanacetum coccineum]